MNGAHDLLHVLHNTSGGSGACLEYQVKGMLRELGMSVPHGQFVPTGVPLPDQIGLDFPLVAKVAIPGLAGKSDIGGIRLNLRGEEELNRAVVELSTIPGAVGVLIEEMAPPGVEVIVGGSYDPQFGPIVMFGLGGILVELCRDVAFGLAPLTNEEALRLARQPKGARVLNGFRGKPPIDFSALTQIMVTVSELMATGLVEEIDLNPVALYPVGAFVLDAKLQFRDTPLSLHHNP